MLCTAMESRGIKWRYLRVTSLFDPYTSWVAKHESPHSGFATMLDPRISHTRIDMQIVFKPLVQAFSARLMQGLSAAVLGRQ
jgi:hypothetical protein